jgi:hypothetical protein
MGIIINLLQTFCIFFVLLLPAIFVCGDYIKRTLELSQPIPENKKVQRMTHQEEPGVIVYKLNDSSVVVTATEQEEEEEEEEEEDTVSDDPVDISEELDIDSIKKEIESTCNFDTASEGVAALKNDPSEITDRLKTGFDLWEQRTGKKGMTYSEMREMFG